MQILRAKPDDAARLTAIAFTAKRHWGYPEPWIEEWKDVLTLTPEYIRRNLVWTTSHDREIVGFGGGRLADECFTLDHLWIMPATMKSGLGRALFREIEAFARAAGARRIALEADPQAEGFYLRMGATTVGHVEASVAGQPRLLPKMEKSLR